MPTVVSVKFKYAARDLWFDAAGAEVAECDHVICQTERGTEIGLVTADPQEVTDEEQRAMTGDAPLKPVLRIATEEDLARAEELADKGDEAMPTFRSLVSGSGLDMKPVGVEYLFGGEKVVCYFSADDRVDFRQLVRDMARELHERIDMRQIGVREEAAIIGGYAHCGQELCCARFGNQFEPVSIRMAKEQDLPLNSTKISGACGRLMCCLRYEFEAYRDFKGRAPKKNAVIETPLGKGKIIEYDTPKEQLALRLENGKVVRVALADMEASEAAVKKSEELHCPCRPDTVTRQALERLATPEVQLALAELDREMGLVPDESELLASDLFVEAPKPRRRRRAGREASQDAPMAPQDVATAPEQDAAVEAPRSRRRRKKRAGEGEAAPVEAPKAQASRAPRRAQASEGSQAGSANADAAPKSRRRRRHHTTGEGEAAPATAQAPEASAAQGQQDRTHTSRRRRSGGGSASGEAAAAQGAQPRARRRPGDHGGHAAQTGTAQERKASPAPQAQHSADASGERDGAPKRRRRHRGGRGRGKGTGEGTTPASE